MVDRQVLVSLYGEADKELRACFQSPSIIGSVVCCGKLQRPLALWVHPHLQCFVLKQLPQLGTLLLPEPLFCSCLYWEVDFALHRTMINVTNPSSTASVFVQKISYHVHRSLISLSNCTTLSHCDDIVDSACTVLTTLNSSVCSLCDRRKSPNYPNTFGPEGVRITR